MSPMPASALRRWQDHSSDCALLVQVDNIGGTSRYFSTASLITPDGVFWQGLITDTEPIVAPGEFLGSENVPVSAGFTLGRSGIGGHAVRDDNFDSIKALFRNEWRGKPVTFYLWSMENDRASELFQVFSGRISSYSVNIDEIEFKCSQGRDWSVLVPDRIVSRQKYPAVSPGLEGTPIPVLVGDCRPLANKPPFSSYGEREAFENLGGHQMLVPALLVDVGEDEDEARIVVAGHPILSFGARSDAESLFSRGAAPVPMGDGSTKPGTFFNLSDEAGLAVPDNDLKGRFPVPVGKVVGSAGTVTNARAPIDATNDQTFMRLAPSAWVEFELNAPGSQGTVISGASNGYLLYRTESVASCRIRWPAAGGWSTIPASPSHPFWGLFGDAHSWAVTVGADWDLSGVLRIENNDGTFNLDVWAVGIAVQHTVRALSAGVQIIVIPPHPREHEPRERIVVAPTFVAQGSFMANARGWEDTTGDFSVTPLIEKVADVIKFLMVQYGGLTLSTDFEIAADTFGSFIDGREAGTLDGSPLIVGGSIAERGRLAEVVTQMAEGCGAWVYQDRFSGKFHFVQWRHAAPVTRTRKVRKQDIGSMIVDVLGSDGNVTHSTVRYGYDALVSREAFISQLAPDGSSGSHDDTRDQKLTVSASNLNHYWNDGAARSGTLTTGDYTPQALAAHVQAVMRVLTSDAICRWGYYIEAGLNDKLDFDMGAGTITATIPAKTYPTAQDLAAAVQAAMRTAAGAATIDVTVKLSSQTVSGIVKEGWEFTIARNDGGTFSLLFSSGPNSASGIHHNLGFYSVDLGPFASRDALAVTGAERFIVLRSSGSRLELEYGQNPFNNSSLLLGYVNNDVGDAVAPQVLPADYRRSDREAEATTNRDAMQAERETAVSARWVRDPRVARHLRDLRFDGQKSPRAVVTVVSLAFPDVRRGEVLEFDGNVNDFLPYPVSGTDGSWAGKRFWVISTRQNLGRGGNWMTELELVEAF